MSNYNHLNLGKIIPVLLLGGLFALIPVSSDGHQQHTNYEQPADSLEILLQQIQQQINQQQNESATNSLQFTIDFVFKNNIIGELPGRLINSGDQYLLKENFEAAAIYYQGADNLLKKKIEVAPPGFDKIHHYNLKFKIYNGISSSYEGLEDFDNALVFHKNSRTFHDSIRKIEKQQIVLDNKIKYEVYQKETDNDFLKARQAIFENSIKRRNVILSMAISVLLISFFWAISFFRISRKRKNYARQLETEVKKRTTNLRKLNHNLHKNNKELQAFAYITAHDLKEPLRNISGFASLLERDIQNEKTDNMLNLLQFIQKNIKQMFALIEAIAEYTRVGKINNEEENLSLEKLEIHILDELSSLIKDKNAFVDFQFTEPDDSNFQVPYKLKIALKKLVANGIWFNERHSPHVQVIFRINESGKAVFSVIDDGIGISMEFRDRIFEMFKRLHTREEYEGAGVGLAICKKIVESLDGNIYLQHSDENGSHFKIEIPTGIHGQSDFHE